MRVRAALQQCLQGLVGTLEDGAGQRCLAAVVRLVRVGATRQQQPDDGGVAVVGGQHQQGVAAVVGEVHRRPGGQEGAERLGVAAAGGVEDPAGQLDQLGLVGLLGGGRQGFGRVGHHGPFRVGSEARGSGRGRGVPPGAAVRPPEP